MWVDLKYINKAFAKKILAYENEQNIFPAVFLDHSSLSSVHLNSWNA